MLCFNHIVFFHSKPVIIAQIQTHDDEPNIMLLSNNFFTFILLSLWIVFNISLLHIGISKLHNWLDRWPFVPNHFQEAFNFLVSHSFNWFDESFVCQDAVFSQDLCYLLQRLISSLVELHRSIVCDQNKYEHIIILNTQLLLKYCPWYRNVSLFLIDSTIYNHDSNFFYVLNLTLSLYPR